MAAERPPAPAEAAQVAFAAYNPDRRQFIARTGGYRLTGVLAEARLARDVKTAREFGIRAKDDGLGNGWKVVPVYASEPQEWE